jgi:uncharacterized membrane protein
VSIGDAAPTRAVANARTVVLALVAALCVVLVAWHVARYSAHAAAFAIPVLVTPWALPLRGLLRGDRRTYVLTPMVAVPYLAYGLMEVLANPGARAYAGATVLLAFAIVVAAIAFLRVSRPPPQAPSERTAP